MNLLITADGDKQKLRLTCKCGESAVSGKLCPKTYEKCVCRKRGSSISLQILQQVTISEKYVNF